MTASRTLMPLAAEAVARAAKVVREARPGVLTFKGDRDMASEVDYQVEREMRRLLSERAPAIGFMGEEDGMTGSADTLWTLDPVDGTANFVRGIPLCAISLALVIDRQPVLAVISLPFLQETYTAERGGGAFEGNRRLKCSGTSDLIDAIVSIGDYAVGDRASEKNRIRFALTEELAGTVQRVRMLGTAAIDLAWVASGRLDASIMISNKPWETAAGTLVAREAGATVVDDDGSPHSLRSEATIAVTPKLLPGILTVLSDASRSAGETW
jgi:myo-inositol-1(or 4)-monophosphatase